MTLVPLATPPDDQAFTRLCETASAFWTNNVAQAHAPADARGETGIILVEMMTEDLRVSLRNLTFANALRRVFPARIVAYLGSDSDWNSMAWENYDKATLERFARAYGAVDIVDVHELVDARIAGEGDALIINGEKILPSDADPIDEVSLDDLVRATTARVLRVPRITDEIRSGAKFAEIHRRSEAFSEVYDSLMSSLKPVALVSSHVDYNHWGLAVESALRFGVPITHVQSTGALKAYTLFPEQARPGLSFRANLTLQMGDYFERHLWPHRDLLRRSAELTTWRAKSNLGRPSWWRGGGAISSVEFGTRQERQAIRDHAMDRMGFDRSKPVVAVYNHAVSDALNTNVERFEDLAQWFEETAQHAVSHPEVNWLFIDHPHQFRYDTTGFFDAVKHDHEDQRHMAFMPSLALSKNVIWSLVDLGVTVRGSISAELPAYGVPAIQAGWSEWSGCGFTKVADDVAHYWRLLDEAVQRLADGQRLITDEQIERARLWLWFYRAGGDVTTPLVPHWDLGQGLDLFRAVTVAMRHMESDGDPSFVATRRLWTRREPVLTRFDVSGDIQTIDVQLGSVDEPPGSTLLEPGGAFLTSFDAPVVGLGVPGALRRGDHPALRVVDNFVRGAAIPGRFATSPALVGLKVAAPDGGLRVTIRVGLDDTAESWWRERVEHEGDPVDPALPRVVHVSCQGQPRGVIGIQRRPADGALTLRELTFDLEPHEFDTNGLLVVEVKGVVVPDWARERLLPHASVGLRLEAVALSRADGAAPLADRRPVVLGAGQATQVILVRSAPGVSTAIALALTMRRARRKRWRSSYHAAAVRRAAAGSRALSIHAVDLDTSEVIATPFVLRPPTDATPSAIGTLDLDVTTGPALIRVDLDPELSQRLWWRIVE